MTQNPNIPSSAPSETSTLLVSRLRTTLDTQWKKFDDSLSMLKWLDSQYNAMKSWYEWLKSDLAKIANDDVLKKDTSIQSKLDEFLIKIATHLTDATRDRQYDGILTETQSKVWDLRSEIYGQKPELSIETIPNPALLAVGGASAAALASGSALDIGKVAEWTQAQVQESTKGFRGWVAEKVKAPWMMGDIFRDLEKKATSWVKDLTTPPTGSWIDSPWEHMKFQLKKWFAPLLAGWFGINLDGTKPGGVTPGQKPEVKPDTIKDRYTASRFIFEWLFLSDTKPPVTDILSHIEMKWTKLGELKSISEKKDYAAFLKKLWMTNDEAHKKALDDILWVLFSQKKWKYILESYNGAIWKKKDSPYPVDITFGEYITSASKVLKRMRWVAKAAMTQQMPQSNIKIDTNTWSVSFENNEEWEELTSSLFDGDKKLLGFMLTTNAKSGYKIGKSDEFFKWLENDSAFKELYPTPIEKEKAITTLRKITSFSDKFMDTIKTNEGIHLGMNSEIAKIISERTFTLRGMALIYISMEGKNISNFSDLSTVEQAQVYGIVTTIFQTVDKSFDKAALVSRYISKLNDSNLEIPKWVREFLIDATDYAVEKWEKTLVESIKYFFWLASENPKLAIAFAAMNLPIIPARDSAISYIFQ